MEKKERALFVIKYGAYTCGIMLLFAILLPMLGASLGLAQNLLLVVLGAEIIFCCQEYKRITQEPLVFKDAFALGWQVSFFAGLMNAILIFVMVKMVGQEQMLANFKQYRSVFITQGQLDEKSVDLVLQTMSNVWFLTFLTLTIYLLFGFFLSVVLAFFLRTPPSAKTNEEQY
jgi:hypothetical protein